MEDELGGAQASLLKNAYSKGYGNQDLRLPPLRSFVSLLTLLGYSMRGTQLNKMRCTGVSFNGRTAASKTANEGSIPSAPANYE
jgi:hypothetical protein